MAKTLKSLQPFLKYASDLDSSEPIISLCCRMYYLDQFLAIKKSMGTPPTPEEKEQLGTVFKQCEEGKKTLGMSKEEYNEYLEQFFNDIFYNFQ